MEEIPKAVFQAMLATLDKFQVEAEPTLDKFQVEAEPLTAAMEYRGRPMGGLLTHQQLVEISISG